MECQPARSLETTGTCCKDAGGGHRLETFPDEPSRRKIRCPQASRVPFVLALFFGPARAMDESPDRYCTLVLGVETSAKRRSERGYLCMEGRQEELGYDHGRIRLWTIGQT